METIILIFTITFWIVYYILQGMHDVNIVQEVKLLRNNISNESNKILEKDIIKKELGWKFWGSLEKALVKIVGAVIIYLFTSDIYFAFLCLILSVSLRWLVHDLTVAIGLGKGFSHIGPDFIWTDKVLQQLHNKGINQYFIKLTLNLLLLALSIFHLYL